MGLLVDNFAGGGGASTGIEAALGRPVDIAVNHDLEALAMHAANHPGTLHLCEDVWAVDPVAVCKGRPVDLAWFSPDCKHFSKAKGGKPKDKKIRGLAWVAVRWARRVSPRVICLENVKEFAEWGPLDEKGKPIESRKGETFQIFIHSLRNLGYRVEWRELQACDYGAPTSRNRLVLIARCDGEPVVWPDPTHGPGKTPYRTAAECIDWSLPCPSIFDRKKPLADATCRRIAKGIVRYVLNNPKPFLVENNFGVIASHVTKFRTGAIGSSLDEPLHTVTAGGNPARPSTGNTMGLVSAFLAKHYTGVVGSSLFDPIGTITAVDHHSLVAAHVVRQFGKSVGSDCRQPVGTITAGGGGKTLLASSFLVKYYGTGTGQNVALPLGTITGKDRFGLVTVRIEGEDYV